VADVLEHEILEPLPGYRDQCLDLGLRLENEPPGQSIERQMPEKAVKNLTMFDPPPQTWTEGVQGTAGSRDGDRERDGSDAS
ncbi:MAG: hypothetical protein ABIG68_03805, partial [Acidobacteriota bacterium]